MTTINDCRWSYEYLPYVVTEADGSERELPNYRIAPMDDPEHYVAETNEHLTADIQEEHARLIAAAPKMLDVLFDIKSRAQKSGDCDVDPFALLDLILDDALAAILLAIKE